MSTKKLLMLLMLVYSSSYAQSNRLKLNLDDSGKTYVKASVRMQLWARYFDSNPGTTINGEAANNVFDISMRRLRMGRFGRKSSGILGFLKLIVIAAVCFVVYKLSQG